MNSLSNQNITQRFVNKELGKNITKDHKIIYDEIEKKMGKPTKICNFGNSIKVV